MLPHLYPESGAEDMITIIFVLHALAATLWIGGIFFAHMALRPAALKLDPPLRIKLWATVFSNFFPWVWIFIAVLLVTGYSDLYLRFGGIMTSATYLHLMHGIGLVMILLFTYLYFKPYKTLVAAVQEANTPLAAASMNRIRPIMVTNLVLGILIIIIGVGGAYF